MSPQEIVELLRPLCPFYYWPNDGNLGDLLIAEATRQFFRRHGLSFREFHSEAPPSEKSYALVYGGGGRFTSHWGPFEEFTQAMTAPAVSRCIILPHSLSGVDSFILSLDERCTIICREERSAAYCRSLKPRARIETGDDMALQAEPGAFPMAPPPFLRLPKGANKELHRYRKRFNRGRIAAMQRGVRLATTAASLGGQIRRVSFLLRTDLEKSAVYTSSRSYDLSMALGFSSCRETPLNGYWMHAFAAALRPCDVVVTDRLHVGILSCLLGKEVYLLDNDYGKLSNVWRQSLRDNPGIHLLPENRFTPELETAWQHFNRPLHRFAAGGARRLGVVCSFFRSYSRLLIGETRTVTFNE